VEWLSVVIAMIEIGLLTVLLSYLLSFFWNTRAIDLVIGFLAFLLLFALANWLHLPVLQKILLGIMEVLVVAVLVIFQPELRIALSRLSLRGRKFREISAFDRLLETLTTSVYRLAEKRRGAIVVLENHDSLDEYGLKAVVLNAAFSSELLESIFVPTTPLHDGAVVLRGATILAASVILPLADDTTELAKSMGTRHRAALGITQQTDALAVVVSEETGKVSIARDGVMTRGVKADRFKGIVRSVFNPPSLRKQTLRKELA
jgi:diadenylate cyclase